MRGSGELDKHMHSQWVEVIDKHGFTMTSVYEIYAICASGLYSDVLICTISVVNSPHLDWLCHLLPSVLDGSMKPECKLFDGHDTIVEITLFDDRFRWHVVDLVNRPIDGIQLLPDDVIDTQELNDPDSSLYLMATAKTFFHAPVLLKPKQIGACFRCATTTFRMGRGMSNPLRNYWDDDAMMNPIRNPFQVRGGYNVN